MSSSISRCSTPALNGHLNNDDPNNMNDIICAICGLHLDTDQSEASAVHATFVSQQLSCRVAPESTPQKELAAERSKAASNVSDEISASSSTTVNSNDQQLENNKINSSDITCGSESNSCGNSQGRGCCGGKSGSMKQQHDNITKNVIDSYLCYGCRIIVREMVS